MRERCVCLWWYIAQIYICLASMTPEGNEWRGGAVPTRSHVKFPFVRWSHSQSTTPKGVCGVHNWGPPWIVSSVAPTGQMRRVVCCRCPLAFWRWTCDVSYKPPFLLLFFFFAFLFYFFFLLLNHVVPFWVT